MINTIITWLSNKKWLTMILVIVYFLAVVLPHEIIGKFLSRNLELPYGIDKYNQIILGLASLALLIYIVPFFLGFRKLTSGKKKVGFYLLTTLALIVLAFKVLMVVNVEIIHIVQYAICAILLYPLFQNYGSTFFWATVLGAIDEAYQYFVLAPFRTDYFDFNDVIIDMLGAGLGLIFLRANGVTEQRKYKLYQSPIAAGTAILVVFFTYLFRHNFLAVYPVEQIRGLPLLLVRRMENGFWTTPKPNITFHIIQPLEGMILILCLLVFYKFLSDNKSKTVETNHLKKSTFPKSKRRA